MDDFISGHNDSSAAEGTTPENNPTIRHEERPTTPESGYVVVGNIHGSGKKRKIKVDNIHLSVEEVLTLPGVKEFAETVAKFGIIERTKI